MKVGIIGLGAMGLPMARHLVDALHEVTVTSRSRGPTDKAVAAGAIDTSGIVRQLLSAASASGYGCEDFSSLGKIVRELGGV
jgi:predicted dinucleotide-binding enzyme